MNQMLRSPAASTAAPLVPLPVDALLKLANEFLQAGRLGEAEKLLDQILSAAPENAPALHLKAVVLFQLQRHQAAAECLEQALKLAPDERAFRRDLCPIYERLGRYQEALRLGQQALAVDGQDLQTLHNMALVHYRQLALDASIACARRALALDPTAPGAHFQLAEALLLRGDFGEGFEEYEWRYRIAGASPPLPANRAAQWDGTALHDTLLLIGDQGFGDVIQFCRYIPWVYQRCQNLVIAADLLMHPLLRQVAPGLPLVAHWNQCPPFAAYCPLSGLPRLHRTTLDNIPGPSPYLHADPEQVTKWRARLNDLLSPGMRRLGIAWAGRPTHNNDFNRSTRLAAFAPVAALDGVALVSLQKGSGHTAIAGYFGNAPLLNLGAAITDFTDTMAVIEALELIITVDTALAHLAAAMGRPVWILLPYAPDWRWLLERDDSPWYPTVRLFRQSRPGDWPGLMIRVAEALQAYLRGGAEPRH